jgi:hypothetical protein
VSVDAKRLAKKHLLQFEIDTGAPCPKGPVACAMLLEIAISDALQQQAEHFGLGTLLRRLELAEAVCYALETHTAVSVVHINVGRALKAWREGRGQ